MDRDPFCLPSFSIPESELRHRFLAHSGLVWKFLEDFFYLYYDRPFRASNEDFADIQEVKVPHAFRSILVLARVMCIAQQKSNHIKALRILQGALIKGNFFFNDYLIDACTIEYYLVKYISVGYTSYFIRNMSDIERRSILIDEISEYYREVVEKAL